MEIRDARDRSIVLKGLTLAVADYLRRGTPMVIERALELAEQVEPGSRATVMVSAETWASTPPERSAEK